MEQTEQPSGAKELMAAIDKYLKRYAENISLAADGHKTKFELDDTVTTKVLKMVDQAANIEMFHKLLMGEAIPEKRPQGRPKKETTIDTDDLNAETEYRITGNAFEERTRAIKQRLNGAVS